MILVVVWAGALKRDRDEAGLDRRHKYVVAIAYVMLGWVAVAAFPDLIEELGVTGVGLIVAGGALYTTGAVVWQLRRPDPAPTVFGYHEIFHLLVIVAAALQYAAVAFYVLPGA